MTLRRHGASPSGTSTDDRGTHINPPLRRKERPPRERLDLFLSAGPGTEWRFHRMGALEPGVFIHDAGLQPPPPEVVAVIATATDVPRPSGNWSFSRLPTPDRDSRHPRFTRVKTGSVVATTEAAVDVILNQGRAFAEYLASQKDLPDAWAGLSSEYDSAKKLTVLKGLGGAWHLSPSGPSAPTMFTAADVPAWFHRWLRVILAEYAKAEPVPPSPAPIDTNPGWPTFGGTPLVGKMVSCYLVDGTSPSRTASLQEAFCRAAGLPSQSAGAYGLGGRAGPRYKEEAILGFDLTSRKWGRVGIWKGLAQRNRVVYMSSYGQLLSFDRLYRRLRGGQMGTQGLWHNQHPGTVLAPASYADWRVLPSDLSGFDQSVQLGLKVAVADALRATWPDLDIEIHSWIRAETLPLITPSVHLDPDRCSVQDMPHGIRSGTKTTSVVGTIINLACALETASRCGLDASSWPRNTEWRFFAYGDDALWAGSRRMMDRLSTDILQSVYAEVGLTATLPGGDDFLARHTMPGRGHAPIAARMVQQRCFNEHEATDALALGRAVLGLVASFENAELLPKEVSARAWEVIKRAAWVNERSWLRDTSTLAEARQLTLTRESALLEETIATMQRKGELRSLLMEADHSHTAAATVSLAEKLGFDVTHDPPAALAAHTMGLSIVWGDMPAGSRLAEALKGFRANAEGPRAAAAWLTSIDPNLAGLMSAADNPSDV